MGHVINPKKKGKEKKFLLRFEVNESQLPHAISSCFILTVTAY